MLQKNFVQGTAVVWVIFPTPMSNEGRDRDSEIHSFFWIAQWTTLVHAFFHTCSLGRNCRYDPTGTYLKQKLHSIVLWDAAKRNRIFTLQWCTAADPVKNHLLQSVPVQSANASLLQSFAALNSLGNPLNGCSSIRMAVLAWTWGPSSFISCLPLWP